MSFSKRLGRYYQKAHTHTHTKFQRLKFKYYSNKGRELIWELRLFMVNTDKTAQSTYTPLSCFLFIIRLLSVPDDGN